MWDFHGNFSFRWKSDKIWDFHQIGPIFTPFLYYLKVHPFSKFCTFLFWDFQRNSAITQVLKTSMWSTVSSFLRGIFCSHDLWLWRWVSWLEGENLLGARSELAPIYQKRFHRFSLKNLSTKNEKSIIKSEFFSFRI